MSTTQILIAGFGGQGVLFAGKFLAYKGMLEDIRKELNFTSLKYHRLDDLTASIDIEPCKLCTYCWNGKE